jgi:4-aminobutyrate aminotransferase-like enzyme
MGKNEGAREYLNRAAKYVVHSLSWLGEEKGIVFDSASGAVIKDIQGREYIDAVSGTNGPLLIGHSHPKLTEALIEQSKKLSHTLGIFDNVPLIELCEKLASITPSSIKKSYICTGGGESVEAALKLIMKVSGKAEFIALHYSYHGLSLGTMSLGGIPSLRNWIPGGLRWPGFQQVPNPYCYRCPFGAQSESCELECAAALRAALDHGTSGQVAAFILELVQGPGGHIAFPQRYIDEVQKICRERDIFVIVDEVQTGLGRCGSWFASDLFKVKPDVIIIGKALGGGYPIGAAAFSDRIASPAIESSTWHSLTFQNDPLGSAVGLAVLQVIEEEKLIERARKIGEYVRNKLKDYSNEFRVIGDIRGPGLFIGIELVKDRKTKEPAVDETAQGVAFARENGLITFTGGAGNVLKIKPPLVITDEQVERMMKLFRKTFQFVQSKADAS